MPFYSFFAHSHNFAVPALTFAPFNDNAAAFMHAKAMLAKEPGYRRVDVFCGDEELGGVEHGPQLASLTGLPEEAPSQGSAGPG